MNEDPRMERGLKNVYAAIVEQDNRLGYVTGKPFYVAPAINLTISHESSSATTYADNGPKVTVTAQGAHTMQFDMTAIPPHILAKLLGRRIDKRTGSVLDSPDAVAPDVALFYITSDSRGKDVYETKFKCKATIPDETHKTKDNTTDSNGHQISFTAVATDYEFDVDGEKTSLVGYPIFAELGRVDLSEWGERVFTPENLTLLPCLPPTASVPAGEVDVGKKVLLKNQTEDATIHYTTDGSEPTSDSPIFVDSIPIEIDDDMTIKAFAEREGQSASEVVEFAYTVKKCAAVQPTRAAGTLPAGTKVSLTCKTADSKIRFTTDGSEPTSDSPIFNAETPIVVNETMTVKAFAEAYGCKNSDVMTVEYTVAKVETPVADPAGGTIAEATEVKISCATDGATIRFTMDGTDPTAASAEYTAPILVEATTTIKAAAFKTGFTPSEVMAETYTWSE